MNIFRNLIVPAALAAAVSLPLAAVATPQTTTTAPAASHWKGHHRRGGMFRALNLSTAQKAQIKQIRQQFRQSHPKGSRPGRAARTQLRTQIMNVLTPQQRTKLQQIRNTHRRGRMLRALNLSTAQKAHIKQIVQQFRQSHPKGSRPGRAERKQLHAQIMNVLTPQQRVKLQQMRKLRKERRERNGQ